MNLYHNGFKKKKIKLNPPEVIPRVSKDTIDFTESLQNSSWDNERKWAGEIMDSNRRYGLHYCLDKLTRGQGSCFFVAVLQQMNRRKVIMVASDEGEDLASTMDTQLLRNLVVQMMRNSRNPKIREIENDYNMARGVIKIPPMAPWDTYLQSMLKEATWADTYIIRATALFLEMNIQIIDIAPKRGPNTYTYNGDPDPNSFDGARETLHIGVINNTHFQSLLPLEVVDHEDESDKEVDDSQGLREDDLPELDSEDLINQDSDDHNEDRKGLEKKPPPAPIDEKCPSCSKTFKNILLHIKKSKKCQMKGLVLTLEN